MYVRFTLCLAATIAPSHAFAALVVDFEDLSLSPGTYYKGADNAGGFDSRGAHFNNTYSSGFWGGWAHSNTTDVTTPGVVGGVVVNESSAYDPDHLADGAGDGSANYGVAFGTFPGDSVVTLPTGYRPGSMRVTNTTWPALSMRDGDSFAKKFGGSSGDDPDYFLLQIIGTNDSNQSVGNIDFYLADYRFQDNSQDYIVHQWTTVDLSSLVGASKLTFALSSTDNATFGDFTFMNTPSYFAMDNLVLEAVPEPGTLMLLTAGAACALWARRRRAT